MGKAVKKSWASMTAVEKREHRLKDIMANAKARLPRWCEEGRAEAEVPRELIWTPGMVWISGQRSFYPTLMDGCLINSYDPNEDDLAYICRQSWKQSRVGWSLIHGMTDVPERLYRIKGCQWKSCTNWRHYTDDPATIDQDRGERFEGYWDHGTHDGFDNQKLGAGQVERALRRASAHAPTPWDDEWQWALREWMMYYIDQERLSEGKEALHPAMVRQVLADMAGWHRDLVRHTWYTDLWEQEPWGPSRPYPEAQLFGKHWRAII